MSETMWALTFDRTRESWKGSTGLVKERVPKPVLAEPDGIDRSNVILRVKYAGFCGSDRGIWWRKSFGDMILGSLDEEKKDRRVVGHELLGEIVEMGTRVEPKYGYGVGQIVSTESHIICGVCHQCRVGDQHEVTSRTNCCVVRHTGFIPGHRSVLLAASVIAAKAPSALMAPMWSADLARPGSLQATKRHT